VRQKTADHSRTAKGGKEDGSGFLRIWREKTGLDGRFSGKKRLQKMLYITLKTE
jgi:uncharacterized protein YwgA